MSRLETGGRSATHTPPQEHAPRPAPTVNAVLWTLAVVFAGTNMAFSLAGQTVIAAVLGGALLACLAVLLVRHLHSRRAGDRNDEPIRDAQDHC